MLYFHVSFDGKNMDLKGRIWNKTPTLTVKSTVLSIYRNIRKTIPYLLYLLPYNKQHLPTFLKPLHPHHTWHIPPGT